MSGGERPDPVASSGDVGWDTEPAAGRVAAPRVSPSPAPTESEKEAIEESRFRRGWGRGGCRARLRRSRELSELWGPGELAFLDLWAQGHGSRDPWSPRVPEMQGRVWGSGCLSAE